MKFNQIDKFYKENGKKKKFITYKCIYIYIYIYIYILPIKSIWSPSKIFISHIIYKKVVSYHY